MESSIRTVRTYSDFFLFCKLYKAGRQFMPLNLYHLRHMSSVDIGSF